jgi:hypothetical protein
MNETNCENALMAKMAEIDGEETEFSSEQTNLHLAACDNAVVKSNKCNQPTISLKDKHAASKPPICGRGLKNKSTQNQLHKLAYNRLLCSACFWSL